ncbi:hypothetical protein FA10DRAFT_270184 [Acaromyces ingoldii]|uniref:Uncharacterized protein n=1 Tax=Acaromyces ingoldii TaxID=215250 RepID=A0A316Y8E9_9BASI|nr:hypothetical protein FA10DRAFT_270184 [Acaromyces ingoldii]PWN86490.1 hypothetical protein FA10DRAFT_270184 [Acaromyces ingoldii]
MTSSTATIVPSVAIGLAAIVVAIISWKQYCVSNQYENEIGSSASLIIAIAQLAQEGL